ncbi:MAG TPA: nitrate- and nitrite sensing domain-containing protein, partial [Polyangiaceae bacterium]
MNLSIRHKLGLLAGIPIVGAILLALQIISGVRAQARKAEALGSIESLAELSAQMTNTVHALQLERASEALVLGIHRELEKAPPSSNQEPSIALAERSAAHDTSEHVRATDLALAQLQAFLKARDVSRLPPRLAGPLLEAQRRLDDLLELRTRLTSGKANVEDVFELHRAAIQAFVRVIADLTDLSDDGELLRSI